MALNGSATPEGEDKAVCGNPRHEQKCPCGHSKHQDRAEVVIVRRSARQLALLVIPNLATRKGYPKTLSRDECNPQVPGSNPVAGLP